MKWAPNCYLPDTLEGNTHCNPHCNCSMQEDRQDREWEIVLHPPPTCPEMCLCSFLSKQSTEGTYHSFKQIQLKNSHHINMSIPHKDPQNFFKPHNGEHTLQLLPWGCVRHCSFGVVALLGFASAALKNQHLARMSKFLPPENKNRGAPTALTYFCQSYCSSNAK